MRKLAGSVKTGIVVGLIAILLIGATVYLNNKNGDQNDKLKEYAVTILEPINDNGYIADHVRGDKDAPVVIFEHADFQCGYCALMNTYVEKMIEDSEGQLAVVYRNYLLSYHQNGTAAASAAEAAGLQGYWQAYANKLFEMQDEWYDADASERTALFDKYFLEVTDNQGDIDKFNNDLSSPNISKKINLDMKIGKTLDIPGTPAFFIDGQYIDWGNADGGSLTINDETIEWDHKLSIDELMNLVRKIVKTKTNTSS